MVPTLDPINLRLESMHFPPLFHTLNAPQAPRTPEARHVPGYHFPGRPRRWPKDKTVTVIVSLVSGHRAAYRPSHVVLFASASKGLAVSPDKGLSESDI